MFFFVSKILDFLLSPVIWILILLVTSLLLKNQKKARRVLISAVFIFFVLSNSFIVDEFVRLTESPMVSDEQLGNYDAGIVLGGGMVTIDRADDRLIFQQNTDRFLQAIRLYKKGKIKKIMLSSGSGSLVQKDILEAALLRRYLTETGIPVKDILIDSLSQNTHENAVNSAAILHDSLPGGKFLLVTSALHMKRAKACFKKQGVETDIFPTNKCTGKQRRWDLNFLLVPDAENLIKWEKLFHEWLGYLVYFFAGYI
jgi:uncharacterized SAM-binding protein YcdF (DUF218 family)